MEDIRDRFEWAVQTKDKRPTGDLEIGQVTESVSSALLEMRRSRYKKNQIEHGAKNREIQED